MKIRIVAIIFAFAFLIQGTLLNNFAFFGITPNLTLCLLIAFTFFYEDESAIYLALFFGIISDICFSNIIGVSSLGYLLVGFLIVKFRPLLNKENILASVIFGGLGTLVFNIFYWLLTNVNTNQYDFTYILSLQPLYVISNLIVMVLIYFTLINRVVRHRSDRYYR
ncbi:MAG: rod shape-determining protein MreD [Peptostreptococcaceae bacterium]|nr:rod shape-determining protein MreD [Peptostreptococcaceae bacterium]